MNQFSTLGLSESVLEVLAELGFTEPTPIQAQAIPQLLEKDPIDCIGLAQTGTGKTAAFGLPLLDLIDVDSKKTQALIMAPTRELGQQTAKQLVEFSRNQRKLNVECVYGGANISTQIRALKGSVQILVATPGRLLDLIKRKAVSLADIKYVVLDEADEMLQMGFKEDIDTILSFTPEERVTWLFSATMPKDIRKIVNKYMNDPIEVAVNTEQKTNENITHQFVITKGIDKIPALRRFLDLQPDMRGVMFCRTRRETQEIADQLGDLGYGVEALHGELSQAQRDAVMKRFKNRSMHLLVATDVAARGIDVNDLTHVIHHRLPDQLEAYTHRSGRTGRAGKTGVSLAFVNSRETRKINELERKLKVKFKQVMVPSIEEVKNIRIQSWAKNLLSGETDPEAENVLKELEGHFVDHDKEDILKRLISKQLGQLKAQAGQTSDLNMGASSNKGRERNPDLNRYFINVGELDGINEKELKEFLSDVSEIPAKHFHGISLQKNCAFFNLDKEKDTGLGQVFEGVVVDGRKIRVNKDDEGNKPRKARGHKFGGKGDNRRNRYQPDNKRNSRSSNDRYSRSKPRNKSGNRR